MSKPGNTIALQISLAYLVVSLVWILLSDRIALAFGPDAAQLALLQSLKGGFFVAFTGAGLYLLLRLGYRRIEDSEAFFRGIFEDAPLGMVIAGPAGRPIRCNPSFERLLGYPLAELCRMDFAEFTHPDDRAAAREAFQRLSAGATDRYTITKRYLHRDGQIIWARLTTSAVRHPDGRLRYVIGMVEDITDAQRQETELRRSRAELTLAQRIAHIGNWEYRVDDGAIRWSDETFRIFGLEPQSETITYERVLQFVHPDDRAAHDDYLQHIVQCPPDQTIKPFSWRLVRSKGELRYVQIFAEPQFEGSQRPLRIFGTIQDVTARELTENALRQSEERLSMALLASHEGIWEWDLSGSTAWWSDPLERTPDNPPAEGDLPSVPAWLLERIHPDDRAAVEDSLRAALLDRTGKQWDIEYRYLGDQGDYQHVVDRAVITRDPSGRAHRVMGARLDMTDAMQARLELDHLFQLAPDVLVIAGLDGFVQRVNPAATRVLGFSEHELRQRPFFEFIHRDDHAVAEQAVGELTQGRTIRGAEMRLLDSDGEPHWFQWFGASLPKAGVFYAIGRDISRQKLAQQRLTETERRWTLALDGAGHGVWDWNAETDKVFFSRGWKTMLGYAEDEIGDSLAEWESRVHPEDLPACRADLQRHFAGETVMYRNQHRMRCKDGSYKWVLDQGTVFERTADGRPRRVVGTHTDLTPLKEAEQALQESEKRYGLAAAIGKSAAWEILLDQGRILFDANLPHLLGYADGELSDDLADWIATVPQEDRPGVAQALESVRTGTREEYAIDHRVLRKDGTVGWVSVRGRRVGDAGSRPLRIVGSSADITERKLAEEALAENRRVMRIMIDALPFWVSYFDRDKRYVIANRRYEETFGRPLAQIEGHLWEEVLPADIAKVHGRLADRCLSGETFVHEESQTLPEIGIAHTRSHYIPVEGANGSVMGGVVVVFDVTEQRRNELALIENEARYRELVENMSDGVAVYEAVADGADFVLVEHNRAGERISGLNRSDVIGRRVTEVFPGIVEMGLLETLRRVRRSGQPEHHPVSHYGDRHLELWVENYVFKLPNDQVVAIYDDVTERQRAAERLQRAHDELERRVAERTAELFVANRELESFTYSVSHDLRAPLRAIRGFVQALREDYGRELVDGARDYLDQIDASGARMGELIDGLLTLSRSGRGEIIRETVDLSAVAVEIAERLQRAEPERAVRFDIQPDLTAQADPRLVKTLLYNLLENAWKYTGQTQNAEIRVGRLDQDGEMVFFVADNGTGFDTAFANKLFEPFQRLHRQDEFPGIGIGLATVRRIVQRHGGWISGDGRPGQGASFHFTLAPAATIR